MSAVPLLEAVDITQRFGAVVALDAVSLRVMRGEIKALIGPNGAGKTTLFDILAGALPLSAGSVRFEGCEIGMLRPFERARLGLLRTFQTVKIFEGMTVLENVMVGRHIRSRAETFAAMLRLPWTQREERALREAALQALTRVGLEKRARDSAADLSYGELKILEIARALAAEPTLLLLDEPVAGVASLEVRRIVEVIEAINAQGVTLLLVEHNMSVVMALSHDIMVLNNGRVLAEGSPQLIQNNQAVIDAYFGEEEDVATGS